MLPYALNFVSLSADKVAVGNCGGTDPTVTSMWAWVNPQQSTIQVVSRVMAKGAGTGATGFLDFFVPNIGTNRIRILIDYTTTDASALSNDNALTPFQWQFVAATTNGTTSAPRMYWGLAGSSISELAYASSTAGVGTRVTDGGNGMSIGNAWAGFGADRGWPGYIYSAGYINGTVLTLAQFQEIANNPLPYANLHSGLWPTLAINGSSGPALDRSGKGFHGVITTATIAPTPFPLSQLGPLGAHTW